MFFVASLGKILDALQGGVDMSSAAPYDVAFKFMKDMLDKAEKLILGQTTS